MYQKRTDTYHRFHLHDTSFDSPHDFYVRNNARLSACKCTGSLYRWSNTGFLLVNNLRLMGTQICIRRGEKVAYSFWCYNSEREGWSTFCVDVWGSANPLTWPRAEYCLILAGFYCPWIFLWRKPLRVTELLKCWLKKSQAVLSCPCHPLHLYNPSLSVCVGFKATPSVRGKSALQQTPKRRRRRESVAESRA